MRMLRKLSSVGAMLFLLALALPLGAGARPPLAPGGPTSQPSLFGPMPSAAGAHLTVTRLSSAPARARRGHAYVLRGFVRNEGSAAVRGRVVVHLLHVGSRPLAVGGVAVRLGAHDSAAYRAHIRLPRVLQKGSYALVACVRRGGRSGRSGA